MDLYILQLFQVISFIMKFCFLKQCLKMVWKKICCVSDKWHVMPHVTQFLLMRSYRVKILLLYFSKTSHLWGINRSYRDLCKWIRRVQGQRGGGECCWKSWWSAGFFNWPAQFQNGRFDLPVLVHAERCLLETLNSSWRSCIDSIAVFRKVFPGQPNYSRNTWWIIFFVLHTRHMMPWKMSHPVPFVQKLCYLTMTSWQIPLHRMLSTTTCYFLRQSKKHYFFRDLDYKILKRATAENIAGSGLNLMQLYKKMSTK